MPHTQLLQALPDAAILTDPSGVIRGWNDAATQLFGWTAAEMVGRSLIERFPSAARAEIKERLKQVSTGGEWDGQFQDYRKDGSRVWIEAYVHPVRDGSGDITGILGISRPISQFRGARIEQDRHDRYAADILNSMSAHVAVLGGDGRIREVNHAWWRFAEENSPNGCVPPSTGVGTDYVHLCRTCSGEKSDEAELAADGIEGVLRGTRRHFVLEYPCDSPVETRWFAMHVTPLSNQEGGAVVAHYDITARKKSEMAVAAQNRKTELALKAAHMGVWSLDIPSGRFTGLPKCTRLLA